MPHIQCIKKNFSFNVTKGSKMCPGFTKTIALISKGRVMPPCCTVTRPREHNQHFPFISPNKSQRKKTSVLICLIIIL